MLQQISKDEELACLMKLHETVQKVKDHNAKNSDEIKKLRELFGDLHEKIGNVFKEQSNSTGASLTDKKKDDKKKQ